MSTMWIEREISGELSEIAASFPVAVVVGPRQVGKASMIERTFASLDYASLNVAANAEMAETRPEDFIKGILPPILNGTCAICSRSVISGILNVFCGLVPPVAPRP